VAARRQILDFQLPIYPVGRLLKSTIANRKPKINGGKGIRTPDFQLAKLALYQLSYAPGAEFSNVDSRLWIARE
jgi:hypothetical protein